MPRDSILRMVEQVAALLATIIAKKQAGQLAEAGAALENACLQTIGLTLTGLKRLSPEAVAKLLDDAGALHTQFVGEVVDVKAEDSVLASGGSLDIKRVRPLTFTPDTQAYYRIGDLVGQAFSVGHGV